ncbi:MAG: extracellular solute-binding protein [Caldilineaceae bacterium]|nr:extracellular solute-binding protein [Caldilineaceae bacterium]
MSLEISRRQFLKMAGVGAAGMALAGCVSPAAAPPGAQPAATSKNVVFSSYTWSGYEAAMRDVITAWNTGHPDVSVEQQYIAEDYWTKVQTQVAGGTPPDVGIADYGRMIVYAKDGVLLNITDWVQRDSFPLDKMFASAVAQYRWVEGDFDSGGEGGAMYGLPSDAQSHIIAYNKTMFDEAGVPYPTDDWTWDDLVEMGKAITKPDENKWGMQVINPSIITKGNFLFSAGGANHSDDLKSSMIDSPESIEAWKWDWDLVYTHQIAPPPGAQAQTNPFMSGQVAMVVDGVWWIADFANITDFEWDIALYPKHPRTGRRTTSLESDGWWVFKSTAEPDLAWDLMQSLANEAGQKRFGELNYIIPSCFPEIGQEWYSRTPPENRLKALDNIVEESHKVDFTYFDFFTCYEAYSPPIAAAFADGTDIEAACVEAAQIHNEELAAAWERFQAG